MSSPGAADGSYQQTVRREAGLRGRVGVEAVEHGDAVVGVEPFGDDVSVGDDHEWRQVRVQVRPARRGTRCRCRRRLRFWIRATARQRGSPLRTTLAFGSGRLPRTFSKCSSCLMLSSRVARTSADSTRDLAALVRQQRRAEDREQLVTGREEVSSCQTAWS